jgi:ribosomal protein S18 acetylase RimI-like enzyme
MEIQIENNIHKDLFNYLLNLYDESFSPHVRVPHYKIRKRIKTKTYELISLKKDNEMIGFSLISLNPLLKTIFIDYLCIDKRHQKGGYGKMLLNEIHTLKFFPEYEYCVLECEDYLVGYYLKNNFQKIPREYPLENPRPLYMLYRKRNSDHTNSEPLLYNKFITYGLLFNGDINVMYDLLVLLYERIFDIYTLHLSMLIMNYKSTHT